MNQSERAKLLEYIVALSAYYQRPLSDITLKMYASDLAGLPLNEILKAYDRYRLDPKNRTMPIPAQIRAMLDVSLGDIDQVQQALALIKKCVIEKQSAWLIGYYWGKHPETGEDLFYYEGNKKTFWSWREAAVDCFGSLGLKMVDHVGGWRRICEMFNENLESVIWSQLLKSGEAVINIHKAGKQDSLPQLPEPMIDAFNLIEIKSLK